MIVFCDYLKANVDYRLQDCSVRRTRDRRKECFTELQGVGAWPVMEAREPN